METRFGTTDYVKQPVINLSLLHVVSLGAIITLIQNLSMSHIPYTFPIIFFISLGCIAILGYSFKKYLPLSTDICMLKFKLVFNIFEKLTRYFKIDIWLVIIIILLVAWISNIWKTGVNMTIWCFTIWVYKLNKNDLINLRTHSNSIKSINNNILFPKPNENVNSFSSPNPTLNSTISYSNSTSYINLLEKKISDLEKLINTLENDKIQQNIMIYSSNHNINERIDNLERLLYQRDQLNRNDFNQIYKIIISLKRRKNLRLSILKMYMKQLILWLLPNWSTIILKKIRKRIIIKYQRIRELFYLREKK